jgi:hypothetical protein
MQQDALFLNLSGERLPVRGGYWDVGARAGVFALALADARSYRAPHIGFRPAFVI